MFTTLRVSDQDSGNALILDKIFRLRKKTFADQLKWDVPVDGDYEYDIYDTMDPLYLVWCSEDRNRLYGAVRLMPTTGPTLLFDVFRRTFPDTVKLDRPGVWEGTRMCIDDEAIAADHPEIDASRAFSLLLLALCECGLAHGIHTMICNYEPQMKRVYRRSGVNVTELGRADGYGRLPVCCGSFSVSQQEHDAMREKLCVHWPLYRPSEDEQQIGLAA